VVAPTDSLAGLAALDAPGTSAAAAYAGATAALVASADPSLSAAAVERRLTRTAADRGPAGPDAVTGHGRVSPVAAVFGHDAVDGTDDGTDADDGTDTDADAGPDIVVRSPTIVRSVTPAVSRLPPSASPFRPTTTT
jgi:hypothetical protein